MDVKSLYTVIPHHNGLRALKFFLDKRPVQELSTSVLVRLAELVLTLNNFSFDGEHYQQRSGVAMGTKMGPNYANLFVGFVEKQIFEQYTDPTPDYLGRYIDANLDLDIACTKSVLFSICPSVLRWDITNFVRMLNSRLYSFLQASKASKAPSRFGQQSRQLSCSDQSGGHDSPRFDPIRL